MWRAGPAETVEAALEVKGASDQVPPTCNDQQQQEEGEEASPNMLDRGCPKSLLAACLVYIEKCLCSQGTCQSTRFC